MPQPRKSQISLIDTPYYHCVFCCVRCSFLCSAVIALRIRLRGADTSIDEVGSKCDDKFLSLLISIGSAATVFVSMR